jgi:8-oxo-dGTP pyrophosphatase MutT (NUDIX family)
MTISADEIQRTVSLYLEWYPDEYDELDRLFTALKVGTAYTSRKEFTGHITCGSVLVDPKGRVLHIKHNALDRWLLPGGHVEPEDVTLVGAALREAQEETGIPVDALTSLPDFDGVPVDIDVHPIPPNEGKGEPAHWHFDFRYAFTADPTTPIRLQDEEVAGSDWLAPDVMPARRLGQKLATLGTAG